MFGRIFGRGKDDHEAEGSHDGVATRRMGEVAPTGPGMTVQANIPRVHASLLSRIVATATGGGQLRTVSTGQVAARNT